MKTVRHILLALTTFLVVYVSLMIFVTKINYKGKPVAFITNDYYRWKGGDTYQKFAEFKKDAHYDFVVLGSSRAYRGYSPTLFKEAGYSMFNLGSSAQSIHNTFYLAKNYLNKKNTGTLILDVFTGAFKKSQLESSSDLIENIGNKEAVYDIAFHTKDIRTVNILMLRFLTEKDAPYFSKSDYAGNGFSVTLDSLNKKQRKALPGFKQPEKATFIIDEAAIECFTGILEYCKTNQIPVIVVYSPVSDFYSRIDHKEFMKSLLPVIKNYNVPFYDYTESVHLSTINHFYDETHMNMAGVQIFNQQLLKDLTLQLDFTTPRPVTPPLFK